MRDTIIEGATIGLRRDLALGRSPEAYKDDTDNPDNGVEDNLKALPLK